MTWTQIREEAGLLQKFPNNKWVRRLEDDIGLMRKTPETEPRLRKEGHQEIELKRIQPNRLNPGLEFGKQALDELADSIRQVGLIEPIVVRPDGKNAYEVAVGAEATTLCALMRTASRSVMAVTFFHQHPLDFHAWAHRQLGAPRYQALQARAKR